ncbi:N-alpha-acetyltransferase 38, NatC auxiliary subunit [Lutzomyia longipalpis]|uniref:N-alpha-acetyltransferase 38, NatC auxiliary subunit n=1 Tax=Lutzomyia longipalpis TaxID=7200 RepID=UPI002484451D|nr:N-alpha-acetyltransferase 38, NatC auxiliary subunit [Lutzomyia longipalpis]
MNYSSDEDLSENDKKSIDLHSRMEVSDTIHPLTPGKILLKSWLNRTFRVVMTDGRILIGVFLCTDVEANVILGMCSEYTEEGGEERILGLVMIPGRHIISMEVDTSGQQFDA